MFFFFKQKTAYEMRISDWSSDVCSSDLIAGVEQDQVGGIVDARGRRQGRGPGQATVTAGEIGQHTIGDTEVREVEAGHCLGEGDRKSVVSGKSVSVRVDLGGRRIIKKTNKQWTTDIEYDIE